MLLSSSSDDLSLMAFCILEYYWAALPFHFSKSYLLLANVINSLGIYMISSGISVSLYNLFMNSLSNTCLYSHTFRRLFTLFLNLDSSVFYNLPNIGFKYYFSSILNPSTSFILHFYKISLIKYRIRIPI